ncbi:imidazolonepropionase-like domain-containing protein [Streptomyces sp. S186]|uniref:imidazolonepropionase-like domain-containing protein n=1 Tax=Streptomyces sp. S186 TaxID=3434395 RepID=UPI003F66D841
MLTLHRVRAVRLTRTEDTEPLPGYAVLVDGDRLAAIGPYEELLATYGTDAHGTDAYGMGAPSAGGEAPPVGAEPGARPSLRVREWDGILTPGRHEPNGAALLEAAYHPDPREAAELGTEPLTGAALAALPMTETRWGASARRGLQRLLAAGTTTLAGPFTHPAVRAAVQRSGLRQTNHPERADHPESAEASPSASPSASPALAPGARADFAVFAPDGTCLATVLSGRLVHRRR